MVCVIFTLFVLDRDCFLFIRLCCQRIISLTRRRCLYHGYSYVLYMYVGMDDHLWYLKHIALQLKIQIPKLIIAIYPPMNQNHLLSHISLNHYSLFMANRAEIESDEHKIIKKDKKFFEEGIKINYQS